MKEITVKYTIPEEDFSKSLAWWQQAVESDNIKIISIKAKTFIEFKFGATHG